MPTATVLQVLLPSHLPINHVESVLCNLNCFPGLEKYAVILEAYFLLHPTSTKRRNRRLAPMSYADGWNLIQDQ